MEHNPEEESRYEIVEKVKKYDNRKMKKNKALKEQN